MNYYIHPQIVLPGERSEERNENIAFATNFSVAPNPANNYTQFRFSLQEDTELQIYDIAGILKYSTKLSKEDNSHRVNTENFTSGIYFYSIPIGEDRVEKGRIIVLK